VLNLSHNQIGEEGVKALAQNTSWISLRLLCLVSNKIGTEGAKVLPESTFWTHLKQLHLWEDSDVGMLLKQEMTCKRKDIEIF